MDEIYNTSTLQTLDQTTAKSINKPKYLLAALGIIVMLGSLGSAAGLYSQLGNTSFIVGGCGVVTGLVCLILSTYFCSKSRPKQNNENDIDETSSLINHKQELNEPQDNILEELVKNAQKEEEAFLIDFSRINPTNIFKIFNKDSHLSKFLGDASIRKPHNFTESEQFTENFPHVYQISIVCEEKNPYGHSTSNLYYFTMNDEGKVESYGKVLDNFELFLEHKKKYYRNSEFHNYKHLDFDSILINGERLKLRKKFSNPN